MTNHSEVRFFSAFRVRGSSPPGMPSADSRWRGWGGGSFFPTIFSRQISKLLSKFVVLQKYPNRSYDVLYAYVFYRTTIFLIRQVWTTLWNFLRPSLNRRYAWVACVSTEWALYSMTIDCLRHCNSRAVLRHERKYTKIVSAWLLMTSVKA